MGRVVNDFDLFDEDESGLVRMRAGVRADVQRAGLRTDVQRTGLRADVQRTGLRADEHIISKEKENIEIDIENTSIGSEAPSAAARLRAQERTGIKPLYTI